MICGVSGTRLFARLVETSGSCTGRGACSGRRSGRPVRARACRLRRGRPRVLCRDRNGEGTGTSGPNRTWRQVASEITGPAIRGPLRLWGLVRAPRLGERCSPALRRANRYHAVRRRKLMLGNDKRRALAWICKLVGMPGQAAQCARKSGLDRKRRQGGEHTCLLLLNVALPV